MPKTTFNGRGLDARPDRVDLRDRQYRARLVSLPPRYPDLATIQQKFPAYRKAGLILDQGAALPALGAVTIEVLTDERERADSVGPYGKSLLYLISRGLENHHKTPVLGQRRVWEPPLTNEEEWGNKKLTGKVAEWKCRRSSGSPARACWSRRSRT